MLLPTRAGDECSSGARPGRLARIPSRVRRVQRWQTDGEDDSGDRTAHQQAFRRHRGPVEDDSITTRVRTSRVIAVFLAVAIAASVFGCSSPPDVQTSGASGPVGTGLPRRKPDVHFLPSPDEVVNAMLRLADVGPNDVVYDLGSGDGRIVIAAAKAYRARGVGIEIDPKLVAEATRNAQIAGVSDRVTFKEGDIFEADISEATVVTLFLLSTINDRLRPKLMRELKPGTRIASYRFPIGDWAPEKEIIVGNQEVFVWTIPAPGGR